MEAVKINKYSKHLGILIAVCFLLRVGSMFLINLNSEEYWEYGEIAKNIINGKGYSLFYIEDGKLLFKYNQEAKPQPSAYMPPGYVFFLSVMMRIDNIVVRNVLIFTIHALLSCLALLYLFRVLYPIHKKAAYISAFIYSVLPEMIFASNTIGTTAVYHFGVALLLYLYLGQSNNKFQFMALLLGALILFRSEVFLLALIIIGFLIIKKQFKNALIMVYIIISVLAPWQIRNYIVFKQYVPFTTNNGLNLYRGHNEYRPGVWADEKISQAVNSLPDNDMLEINFNKVYTDAVKRFISEKPELELELSLKKFYHLWIYDENDSRSTHPLYLIPWFIMLLFGALGIYYSLKLDILGKIRNILLVFLSYHTALGIFFFAIARYQTMLKIGFIPFAALGAYYVYMLIVKKRSLAEFSAIDK